MIVSWDRVRRKCENCTRIQAEYEKKLQDAKEFYDKRLKASVARSANSRHMKRLEEDNQILLRAMQLQSVQSVDDRKQLEGQLEENEKEIEQLQLELVGLQMRLESKKKKQDELKSDLHKITQLAEHCPVYNSKERRAHFERKRVLCEIQSLVVKFFTTCNLDEKNKLHDEIRAKFSPHFTSIKRRKSFSL